MKYLLTIRFQHRRSSYVSYHYDITDNPEKWVEETQQFDDGDYFVINVMPISEEFAKKWDGELKGM